jgi:hypothetical protein
MKASLSALIIAKDEEDDLQDDFPSWDWHLICEKTNLREI